MPKDKAELSLLLDYYGAFLTERQRELMRMSADEDMSLTEIGEAAGVSRQGARNALVSAALKLSECEEKLGLIKRDAELRAILTELDSALDEGDEGRARAAAGAIRSMLL